MAQEIVHIDGTRRVGGAWVGPANSRSLSKMGETKSGNQLETATVSGLQSSHSILNALGDESSRRILTSAIASGKTVEEISAEQNLPLSTCYRRVRHFVDEGLMILERLVVTQAGKRYAVYRTAFSDVTVRLYPGQITVETTPNLEVLEKLRTKWLSTNYPSQNQDAGFRAKEAACRNR